MKLKVIIAEYFNIARIKGREIPKFDEKLSHRTYIN